MPASIHPTIAVIGSCNVDLVAYVRRVPEAGETVLGERFAMGFGGKGANQAVMAARLGARVAMLGAVGDDAYGEQLLANLEAESVETTGVARMPGSSGVAPILVEPGGTNRIVVIPGANGLVDPGAVARSLAAMDQVDVVLGQLEIPQAVTAAAFEVARGRGATTVLNPAPAATLEPRLLAATDWLIPNAGELEALTGRSSADDALLMVADDLSLGLVVSLGADGAVLVRDSQVARIAAPTVAVVDTTGAGDAFVGAFGVGLALGLDPVAAVRLGIACASDSVGRPGAQASYPDRRRAAELRAWVMAAAG